MAAPKLSTRLFRASEKLRDKDNRLAILLSEAGDRILFLEGSPQSRRDIKFQRTALKYLKAKQRI